MPSDCVYRRPDLLSFDQAKRVGEILHDRWHTMAGAVPLDRDDMAWGDIVQFVLRMADELVCGERE
ncbi:MAG: hypothetical protein K2X76_15815 [Sphingomonas sp.]|nr:hypothetical protein [Sphingomonas sp.]